MPFLLLWNVNLPENVENWTVRCHVRPNRAKICCAVFVRSVQSPWTPPDLPNLNLNYEKTIFGKNNICRFFQFVFRQRWTSMFFDNICLGFWGGVGWVNSSVRLPAIRCSAHGQPLPRHPGHLLVNLVFWIFSCSIIVFFLFTFVWIFPGNMLVRYRGINNKGVLERPWTKWRVLNAISNTLRFQFTVKWWKVDFLTSSNTRSCQSSREKLRMLHALLPDTLRPPQFQPELQFFHCLWKTRFFQVH